MVRVKSLYKVFLASLCCVGFFCYIYKLASITATIMYGPEGRNAKGVKRSPKVAHWTEPRSIFSNANPAVSSVEMLNGLQNEPFVINTEHCYIPAFTEAMVTSFQKQTKIQIDEKLRRLTRKARSFERNVFSWTSSQGTVLNLKLNTRNTSNIKCCLRKVNGLEINAYNRITRLNTSQKCTAIPPGRVQPVSIRTQRMVLVECFWKRVVANRTLPFQNVHLNIPVQRKLSNFWKNFKEQAKTPIMPSSVFLIGVDRLSYSSLQAYLPESFKILTSSKNKFTRFKGKQRFMEIEMEIAQGFSSLGDSNVHQSLIPLLTGKSYGYWLRNCDPDEDTPKREITNNCDIGLLWKLFWNLKYETLVAEEISLKFALNPRNSFVYNFPDRDRDIQLAASSRMNTLHDFQLAQLFLNQSVNPRQQMFESAMNFYTKFSNMSIPTFSFLWFKDYVQNVREFDEQLSQTLNSILAKSKNTFIILLSGRGTQAAQQEAELLNQKLDQLLPVLFIRLPPGLDQIEPKFSNFLELNSNRLTTPFDVHETLKSIITIGINSFLDSGLKDIGDELGSLQKSQLDWVKLSGVSLITQGAANHRTCAAVKIPLNSCPCSQDSTLAPSRSVITSLIISKYGLEQANVELMQDTEFRSLCSIWEFETYLSTKKIFSGKNSTRHEDVELSFRANPGLNTFRIRCRFVFSSNTVSCDTSTFERLSRAPAQESYCLEPSETSFDPRLCYCNEL